MKNDKVFGYVLRPRVQGSATRYLRRGKLGWGDKCGVIGFATVVKLRGNAERLAAQLDAEAVPVYGDPRKLGDDALTPKCLWLIRLEGRGPVEIVAHRVTWHPNWGRTTSGRLPVFADGDSVPALPLRAKVKSVEKAPEGYFTRADALRDCFLIWDRLASRGTEGAFYVSAKLRAVQHLHKELRCKTPFQHCPCCHYVKQLNGRHAGCSGSLLGTPRELGCPLAKLWPNGCRAGGSPYLVWTNALDPNVAAQAARRIANAAKLELAKLAGGKPQ